MLTIREVNAAKIRKDRAGNKTITPNARAGQVYFTTKAGDVVFPTSLGEVLLNARETAIDMVKAHQEGHTFCEPNKRRDSVLSADDVTNMLKAEELKKQAMTELLAGNTAKAEALVGEASKLSMSTGGWDQGAMVAALRKEFRITDEELA